MIQVFIIWLIWCLLLRTGRICICCSKGGSVVCFMWLVLKAPFSFHKIAPKILKWLPYIICHCTSLSPWFIILDKINFVNVSHHYWITIQTPMYSMMEWWSERGFFPCENTSEGCTETHKRSFIPNKQVIKNDLEWQMLSYYVIYYETSRNVMQHMTYISTLIRHLTYNPASHFL